MYSVSGCGAAASLPIQPQPTASPNITPIIESPQFFATGLVVAEAAKHAGVTPEEVSVIKSEARDWPDASLGCPKPSLLYAQVVTPGFMFQVKAGGKTLEYHTDLSANQIVLCKES